MEKVAFDFTLYLQQVRRFFACNWLYLFKAITIFGIFVPFLPSFPRPGLDPAWELGINQAAAQLLAFGKDIMFTFGPYASVLTTQYHPATDSLMVLASSLLALSYLLAVLIVSRNTDWRLSLGLTLCIALFAFSRDALINSFPLLFSLASYQLFQTQNDDWIISRHLKTTYFILSMPLGLLVLVKGSILLLCFSILLLNIIYLLYKNRKDLAGISALTPLLSMVILWLIAGQSLTELSAYFKSIFLLATGYSDAMSLYGPLWEIVLFLLSSVLLLRFVYRLASVQTVSKVFIVLVLAIFLFISFKLGFVRHDSTHAMRGVSSVLIAAFLVSYLFQYKIMPATLMVVMFFCIHIGADNRYSLPGGIWHNFKATYVSPPQWLAYRIFRPDYLQLVYTGTLQELETIEQLPKLEGSADIYSYNISSLLASQSNWNPRPVLQSYAAFSPTLLQVNRDHLTQPNAPDHIFFNMWPIDGRVPSMDDGLSWPALLSRYRPLQFNNPYLLLQKRPVSEYSADTSEVPTSDERLTVHMGQAVRLPDSSAPKWLSIDIQPNVLGKFRNLIYKLPHLTLHLKLKNGSARQFRLISGIAKSGFLISPLVEDSTEFSLLYGDSQYLLDKRVDSFALTSSDTGTYWPETFTVSISDFSPNHALPENAPPDVLSLYSFNTAKSINTTEISGIVECSGSIDGINNSPAMLDRLEFSGTLRVYGWLVASIAQASLADEVYLTLKGSSPDMILVSANRVLRPDIAQRSKIEAFYWSGFYSFIDISKLSGKYTLGLAYKKDKQIFRCNNSNFAVNIQ